MLSKVFLVLIILSIEAQAQNPSVVFKNNKGAGLLQEEDKVFEGAELLQKEVVNHPQSPELKYNLGSAMELSKENEKAIQEYLSAAKIAEAREEKQLQFQAYFNAARLYGDKKDIPNALKYYQAALEATPDSQEVKTNIELLLAGGGGGGGSSQQQDQKQDQNKQDNKEQQQPQDNPQNQQKQNKPKPKPFKSEELTEQDVKRILEELKRQEEQIRAKMMNKKSRDQGVEKDW